MTDLVQGLDLGVPGEAFLATTSARMASTLPSLVLGAPSWRWPWVARARFDGIDGVVLALAPALLAVGAVHLDHLHPLGVQVPGQAGPVRARAFHPDPGHRAEPGHPFQQLLVALYRCRERLDAQQPTDLVHHGSHVQFQVGVTPPVTGRGY